MSKASMMLNRVFNLGTCAKLCMNVEGRSYVVLCTVWPDTNDCLLDNMCCIDDSVSIGSRCSEWTESLCEVSVISCVLNSSSLIYLYLLQVVDIWIPKILTSLCYKDESLNVRNSDLLGMAILPGCSINTKRHNSNQICSVVVR